MYRERPSIKTNIKLFLVVVDGVIGPQISPWISSRICEAQYVVAFGNDILVYFHIRQDAKVSLSISIIGILLITSLFIIDLIVQDQHVQFLCAKYLNH